MSLVVSRLIGGLGNQMFQYATGRALALRCGASLKLDLSEFDTPSKRSYELDPFPIHASAAGQVDLDHFTAGGGPLPRWIEHMRRFISKPKVSSFYREPHFHFDSAVMTLQAPIYLTGYWQSEKYFREYADAIRRELWPVAPLEPENADILAQIDAVNAISLHVRRGDYVSDPITNRYHGTCSLDYYRRAIDYVSTRLSEPHFFLFSDDQKWLSDNLRLDVPATVITANPPDRGYRDMQLMACCQHHIIANSSFSWWGAWLNPSPDKIVVAPAQWFSGSDADTSDLLLDSWIRL